MWKGKEENIISFLRLPQVQKWLEILVQKLRQVVTM